jgi:hypothetical protein
MDMATITQYFVPQIVAFCLCVGYVMKRWLPMDNKWIPTALFIVGIVCGIATTGMTFDAVVVGAVSGLASVGLNQSFQQALGLNVRPNIELTDDEVQDYELAEEEDEVDEEGEENE